MNIDTNLNMSAKKQYHLYIKFNAMDDFAV